MEFIYWNFIHILFQAFDRLLQRNERLMGAVKDKADNEPDDPPTEGETDEKSDIKKEGTKYKLFSQYNIVYVLK